MCSSFGAEENCKKSVTEGQLVSRLEPSTHKGATLRAAFCIAFAAFLRIGEFTWSTTDWKAEGKFHQWHMTRNSTQFDRAKGDGTPDRLLLTLPASKTDPFRWGITLTIAAVGDSARAIKALHHLTTTWPSEPHAPLFSNIPFDTSQANNGLVSFDCNWVVSQLPHLLIQEGTLGHYSGHSFRRGAATWAKQVGIPDEDIQLLGRRKSSAYKRYIEVHLEHIFNVSRRLQTALGPPRAWPAESPPTEHWESPTSDIPESNRRRIGGVGRAGRGAGEPGPASGVAAPRTRRGPGRGGRPPAPEAASEPACGSLPTAP